MVAGRFLVVGFTCALLHNVIVISGNLLGYHYVVSSLVSFVIVGVVGYQLHSGWTFPGTRRSGKSFVRYVAITGTNYPLSLAGMFLFVDLLGLPVFVATPIVTVLLTTLNFLGSRWALWAGRKRESRA